MATNNSLSTASKYLFILLLFFLPLSLEKEFLNSGTRLLWFTEPICALLTVLIGVHLYRIRKQKILLTVIDKLALVFLLSVLFSTLLSDDYYVSIKFTISLLWYFSGGYLVVRLFDFSPFQRKASVIAFFLGTLILCLWVMKNFAILGIFYETSYEVSKPFIFEGHTDLSVVVEPALLFSVVMMLIIPWNNMRYLLITSICTTIFLAVIMFSCSKASYAVIFICFCAFVTFILLRKPKFIVKIVYFIIPFVLLLGIWKLNDSTHYADVKNLEESHYNSGADNYDPKNRATYKSTNMFDELLNKSKDFDKNKSNNERINRWLAGLDLFGFNPTFGIGMGTYPDKYLDYKSYESVNIDENYLTSNRMNLHNIFLGWLVEGGIITFLAGVSLIIVFFWWFAKEFKQGKNSYFKILLCMYMISFVVHGLAHDFGQNARVIIPFWITMAIVSKQIAMRKRIKEQKA